MKFIYILVLLGLTTNVHSSSNFMTVEKFLKEKSLNNKSFILQIDAYLMGINSGFSTTNAKLESENKKAIFCLPESFTLSKKNLYKFIDAEIEFNNYEGYNISNHSISNILMDHLIKIFPCY